MLTTTTTSTSPRWAPTRLARVVRSGALSPSSLADLFALCWLTLPFHDGGGKGSGVITTNLLESPRVETPFGS